VFEVGLRSLCGFQTFDGAIEIGFFVQAPEPPLSDGMPR
jgi:hypothetical protein